MNETMQRDFGTTQRRVAPVGQGSWRADEAPSATAVAALRRGLDLGMTHIDTAEMYGSGAAEKIVGTAIEGRRDEVFLVSKVLPTNASKRGTLAACERSLARLRTDRLDCYLLHWRGSHPLEETVAAFDTLVRDGKILSWGVSNFDVTDLDEVTAVAGAVPACNQVLYHLQERAIEHAVLPWCARRGTAVVAYTPFGESPTIIFEPRSKQGRILQEIAAQHRATARQVALAFLLRHAGVFAIPKAADVDHVAENAGAAGLVLDESELTQIDAAFPRGKPRRGLPTI